MRNLACTAAALGLAAGVGVASASAEAIITNGFVTLGVDDFGQLNIPGGTSSPVSGTTVVGLRHNATGLESTAHGCLCEGWGVGIADAGGARVASGSANNDRGVDALSFVSFGSGPADATSVTELRNDANTQSLLRITHEFGPAAETPDLYRVKVKVDNISGAVVEDLRYTRTFDWDIEPDTFSEVVTHAGVASTPSVLLAINNGFVSSDPFDSGRTPSLVDGTPGEGIGDFVDLGPADHGSNFDFGFGGLGIGESFEFDIFYGATRTETAAETALGEVGAELFSLGQAGTDPDGTGVNTSNQETATFIFAFSGIGGEIIIPDPTPAPNGEIPLPAAFWLLATGVGALGARRVLRAPKA